MFGIVPRLSTECLGEGGANLWLPWSTQLIDWGDGWEGDNLWLPWSIQLIGEGWLGGVGRDKLGLPIFDIVL